MKFLDENDEIVNHFEWAREEKWIIHDIPEGHEIIGLYMSKKSISMD